MGAPSLRRGERPDGPNLPERVLTMTFLQVFFLYEVITLAYVLITVQFASREQSRSAAAPPSHWECPLCDTQNDWEALDCRNGC